MSPTFAKKIYMRAKQERRNGRRTSDSMELIDFIMTYNVKAIYERIGIFFLWTLSKIYILSDPRELSAWTERVGKINYSLAKQITISVCPCCPIFHRLLWRWYNVTYSQRAVSRNWRKARDVCSRYSDEISFAVPVSFLCRLEGQ